jgi:hypothetical protein
VCERERGLHGEGWQNARLMYVYIEREREREGERPARRRVAECQAHGWLSVRVSS